MTMLGNLPNPKDVVTDKQAEKSYINLGWIIAVVFIIPLFVTVGEWYVVGESILMVFMLALMAIMTVTQTIALIAVCQARKKNINLSTSLDPFLSGAAVFAWVVAAVIAGSLFVQGMHVLFTWYLTIAIINNGLRFARIQVRKDAAAEQDD